METNELKILCAKCARELEGEATLTCPSCRRAWETVGAAGASVGA